MKTIGLIGGMSWESSIEYYRIINESTRAKLGGLHSAKSIMYSVDFAEIEALQRQDKWETATQLMIGAAKNIEQGGADFVVICTNTMHKVADEVQDQIQIPVLHIADATAEQIKAQKLEIVALLGTRFTMEEDFYKGKLSHKHNLQVMTPSKNDREAVHQVIYEELCAGKIIPSSKQRYAEIIERLVTDGAQGIILGCTEIGLLVHQKDSQVPLFDTTRIHALAAAEYALNN